MNKAGSCEFCGNIYADPCVKEINKDCLMQVYYEGFDDELSNKKFSSYKDPTLSSAYRLGKAHALTGDDIRSVDYLTEDEIMERILSKDDDTI